MRILLAHNLCPFSRQARVVLVEKNQSFEIRQENFWETADTLSGDVVQHSNRMELPVLICEEDLVITGIYPLLEFLEETEPARNLIGRSLQEKIEVRRLLSWFNNKFYHDVGKVIINERIIKYYTKMGEPNSNQIRSAKTALHYHLQYIDHLLHQNKWLAGQNMSLADFAASAQLSILDYLGDITWERYEYAKEWYAIIKSRPSFRPLLNDRILGFLPSKDYSNLDF